jgi:acetyl-CoA carboxylase carboxyl transferase subunit beta
MALFGKPKYSTVSLGKKRDIPANIFTKCPQSGRVVYTKDLKENWMVVPGSGYHFPLAASERLRLLLDEESFRALGSDLETADPLQFEANGVSYREKIAENKKKTGLDEAVLAGTGKMGGIDIAVAVMDFRFLGGSMGSVVGERITRAIERGVERSLPVLIVCASGGARMYEGMYSLMQMAKTSAALARLADAGQPYIAVLTNPTTGGVTASFASLGDLILAEPGALIGFAGPRVIRETTGQELPDGFQTAEFLLERGLVDQIVPRGQLRDRIGSFLKMFTGKGTEPPGGKKPLKSSGPTFVKSRTDLSDPPD